MTETGNTVRLAEVCFPDGTPGIYSYLHPMEEREVEPGCRVIVPFGNRIKIGVVIGMKESPESGQYKAIRTVIDDSPILTAELLGLVHWLSDYYLSEPGEALALALPSGLKPRQNSLYGLSPAGKSELWIAEETGSSSELWRALAEKPLSRGQILRRFSSGAKLFESFRRRGWLEALEIEPATVAPRMEALYVWNKAKSFDEALEILPKHAIKIRTLVELFREVGPALSASEVSRRMPGCGVSLKALVKRELVEIGSVERSRLTSVQEGLAETAADEPKLSDAQEKLVETVNAAILSGTYSAFLLHGVTGSGKSLVYLEAVETAINSGKSAIVLVPEISLTPQLAGRMRRRFGEKVAITHSNISKKERLEVWRLARSGRIKVVIGPRSAVFSPLHDLGLIIVDEEHDNSYKQDYPAPLYNAKAVALYRASRNNATIILGSATPDVVSYHHAEQNRLRLLRLPERHGGAVKPGVRVVKWGGSLGGSVLSPQLKSRLDERLQRGEQTILLVNRRGFSTYIQCPKCGSVASCPNCDIPLKYHRIDTRLACHYCGYVQQVIDSCPECHTMRLKFTGIGTQKVERELELLYPGARIARMDFDTTQRSGEAFAILKGLAAGKYDILLGTQMVAKGHDFPNVTLVGVIGADGEMMQPDFRATERAFRLLLQAAGRTGRGQLMGEVVIQCLNPTEPMFRWVQNGDYHALYNSEIEHRRGLGYPPFGRLISLTASAEQGEYAGTAAQYLADELEQREIGFPVLGPAIPGIERLQGAFRRNLLVKLPPHSGRQVITAKAVIREAVVSTLKKFDREKLQIVIDVDPVEQ